ncbi:MAG: RNA-dependent DNA polymerase [Magnetococcales bacterium]|nr:RNA-dependent DNA polymerase [Magnetococcales bacterium]
MSPGRAGRRTGHLFDAIVSFANLWQAAHKAWRGKKDKVRIADFYFNLEPELLLLQHELISGRYQPRPYHVFTVTDPKRREIAAADFRDRVVHHAIIQILEPLFERRLIFDTYACRLGKGAHAAVQRAQTFARRHPFFLKCDVRKYFQSVDHAILNTLLARIIKDPLVLDLLARIIAHPVPGHATGKGIPIGNLTSQHFANLYLGELDHFLKERMGIPSYLRYMDDFLCFGESRSFLHGMHETVRQFLADHLALELKETATLLTPTSEGIPFLGFQLFPATIRLPHRGMARFRHNLAARTRAFQKGEIHERLLSLSIGSMIGHMVHADTLALRRQLFSAVVDLG